MSIKISDYNNYDYKKEFWDGANRDYEDRCEKQTIRRLIKKSNSKPYSLIDIGGGFGRCHPAYAEFAPNRILLDYAHNLLSQAHANITDPGTSFVQANAYFLPLKSNSIDFALTVRTLHHFQAPDLLFNEVHRVLKTNGYFLFEIPNKRHLVQIFRFFLGKTKHNPFRYEPYSLNDTFINFHPYAIKKILMASGFSIEQSVNTSYFRSAQLKKWFSANTLAKLDYLLQHILSFTDITPSIYILARKTGHSSAR